MSNYKLDVSFDSKKGLLYATLTVPSVVKKKGITMYTTADVVDMLNTQGYSLNVSDCVSKTREVVRTDHYDGTTGKWKFNLTGGEKKQPKKPPVAAPEAPDVAPEKAVTTRAAIARAAKRKSTKKAEK
tara:strand:- start:5021 stop:5404 length:384 start_codon:yes stop_codon:yes gene_type:complete